MNSITIKNVSPDSYNSILLDELALCISQRFNLSGADMCIQQSKDENAKCTLSVAITFVTGVATGIIANAIYDYMKTLFERRLDKQHKTWEVELIAEDSQRVTVVVDSKGNAIIQIESIK